MTTENRSQNSKILETESKTSAPAKGFDQLMVWQKAHQFVVEVYRFTENFSPSENYGLTGRLPAPGA
jgi:hypothetical protein